MSPRRLADQITRLLREELGADLRVTRTQSRLSASTYLDVEGFRVRVSDHPLPPSYGAARGWSDVEVGEHPDADAADPVSALELVARLLGYPVDPGRIADLREAARHRSDAARRAAMTRAQRRQREEGALGERLVEAQRAEGRKWTLADVRAAVPQGASGALIRRVGARLRQAWADEHQRVPRAARRPRRAERVLLPGPRDNSSRDARRRARRAIRALSGVIKVRPSKTGGSLHVTLADDADEAAVRKIAAPHYDRLCLHRRPRRKAPADD